MWDHLAADDSFFMQKQQSENKDSLFNKGIFVTGDCWMVKEEFYGTD